MLAYLFLVHSIRKHPSLDNGRRGARLFWFPAMLGFALVTPSTALTHDTRERVQEVVDELRGRLEIAAVVDAVVVPSNALLVSVELQKGRDNAFQLSFEGDFIDQLDDDELQAVVAHELGHVWIFTHHPYLQTERLANDVAMRVVSRESLRRVYEKAWQRGGVKGDLVRFLGK